MEESVLNKIPQVPANTKRLIDKKVIGVLVTIIIVLGLAFTYISYLLNSSKNAEENVVMTNAVVTETSESEGIAEDVTKDWKTYVNEKYGFSFRYPILL